MLMVMALALIVGMWAAHRRLSRREEREGREVWLEWDPTPVPPARLGLRVEGRTDAEVVEGLIAATAVAWPRRSLR